MILGTDDYALICVFCLYYKEVEKHMIYLKNQKRTQYIHQTFTEYVSNQYTHVDILKCQM